MKTDVFTSESLSSRDFKRLRSLLACAGTDDSREVLQHVRVDPDPDNAHSSVFVATDGRRLRADRFGIDQEAGIYEIVHNDDKRVVLVRILNPSIYPGWRGVVPPDGGECAHRVECCGWYRIAWVAISLGCYVDPALLQGIAGDGESFDVFVQKTAREVPQALLLRNAYTTVVVMPVRVCNEEWYTQVELAMASSQTDGNPVVDRLVDAMENLLDESEGPIVGAGFDNPWVVDAKALLGLVRAGSRGDAV